LGGGLRPAVPRNARCEPGEGVGSPGARCGTDAAAVAGAGVQCGGAGGGQEEGGAGGPRGERRLCTECSGKIPSPKPPSCPPSRLRDFGS
jgi:hypothetical protein